MSRTNQLEIAIIHYLSMIGFSVWQNNNVAVYDEKIKAFRKPRSAAKSTKGTPDIEAVDWWGRYIGIEVKTGKDRLSADQTIFLAETLMRGGIYIIAADIEDVIKGLQFFTYDVNDNGFVTTTHVNFNFSQSIFSFNGEYPNANKIKTLKVMDKAKISSYIRTPDRKKLLHRILGKYSERIFGGDDE